MSDGDIKRFVRRYVARGVLSASVGLAGVSSASAAGNAGERDAASDTATFAQRLQKIREAASEVNKEDPQFRLAQITNFGSFSNYGQDGVAEPGTHRKEHGG